MNDLELTGQVEQIFLVKVKVRQDFYLNGHKFIKEYRLVHAVDEDDVKCKIQAYYDSKEQHGYTSYYVTAIDIKDTIF